MRMFSKWIKVILFLVLVINIYKISEIVWELAESDKDLTSFTKDYWKDVDLHTPVITQEYPSWITQPRIPPIRDGSGKYAIQLFQWKGDEWPAITQMKPSASLATHCTVDKLYHVVELSKYWDGFISVSVFAPGKDLKVADDMIEYMRSCHQKIKSRVSFHIVYQVPVPAIEKYAQVKLNHTVTCDDAASTNEFYVEKEANGKRFFNGEQYPQNLMRNIARSASLTTHCITLDVDMIPSDRLFSKLEEFLGSRPVCRSCCYVLPIYEISDLATFPPRTKKVLLDLLSEFLARKFHVEVFEKNQANSRLKEWEKRYDPKPTVDIMYNITSYQEYWEPITVLPMTAPQFDERFIGYGFTRNSHTYLLHRLGYKFSVLDEAFLVHSGFQTRKGYPPFRNGEVNDNKEKYLSYKREIAARLNQNALGKPIVKMPLIKSGIQSRIHGLFNSP